MLSPLFTNIFLSNFTPVVQHIYIIYYIDYITRKKLWIEVTEPGSKISSTKQLLALILLSTSLLIGKQIKVEISKEKELVSHNKHTIILTPHKDEGFKEARFFFSKL